MFFNCNESSYKVGCWATVVEALGGMAGALWFFSLVLEEKATHWNVLIWLVSFSLKLHFLLKFRRPFFSPLFLVYYFLLLKEVSSCKICFIPLWKKWVFFFFKLAKQGTRNIWICDEPKWEIGHSNFVYCSALWCSLVILGNWVLDLNDSEILVQINLC